MNVLAAAFLGCAAIAAWIVAVEARPYPRRNIRFAALLYAALAAAGVLSVWNASDTAEFALVVALLVSALAPPLLAFAAHATISKPVYRPLAAAALIVTAMAGIFTVITGFAVLALAPQIVAVIALFAVALRSPRAVAWRLGLSAFALLAGSLSVVAESRQAGMVFMLFSAAGLLGVARALGRAG